MGEMNRVTVTLSVAGATDVGRVRRNNEDGYVIADLSMPGDTTCGTRSCVPVTGKGVLLAVADGVGGHRAGEVASAVALQALRQEALTSIATLDPQAALRTSVQRANSEVAVAASAPARSGMAATLTACLVQGFSAYLAEVGDSRAYVLRRGRLFQLTTDQSLVQLLVDSGMSREDACHSQLKNVVLQAVGTGPEVRPGISRLELRRGDLLLLCTDGLTNMVAEEEMADIVLRTGSLEAACARLIACANEHGGRDNITMVLARIEGGQVSEASDEEPFRETFHTLAVFEPKSLTPHAVGTAPWPRGSA